jgi:spore maturation protein CgeB
MKVVYSFGVPTHLEEHFIKDLELTQQYSDGRLEIIPFNHRKESGFSRDMAPWALDDLYRRKDPKLMSFYQKVIEVAKGAHVFFVDQECIYHPDFVKELSESVYTVLYSGDDPESSYFRSKPYLYAFDHAFCYGVYHGEDTKMADKFKEWGSRRAHFKPFGCEHYVYDANLTEDQVIREERDIDIIFIGGVGTDDRYKKLLQIKKRLGKKFRIYGRWGGIKGMLRRFVKGYGLFRVKEVSEQELIQLYKRAKIGINMHLSYGPCNLRLYQLPMNGVMQICDNKKGLSEIYKLDQEVVGYDTIDEAIEKINYYLEHDNKRRQIAAAGFRKAKSCYLFRQTFYDIMEHLDNGIKEKQNAASLKHENLMAL